MSASVTSVEAKLKELLGAVENGGGFESKNEVLIFLEKKNLRKADIVIELGTDLLKNHAGSLGTKEWRLRERIYLAALDCERFHLAEEMLLSLDAKFNDSDRVRCLRGLLLEKTGEFKKAIQFYQKLLEKDPTHKLASARITCCYIGSNKPVLAVKSLRQHLTLHANDVDSWKALVNLYLELSQYDLAKFCLEEILLHDPADFRIHLLYADTLYTLGQYKTAKKYYSQCLVLSPSNLRAMIGLDKCFSRIKPEDLNETDKQLQQKCQLKLMKRVSGANSKMAKYFQTILVSENAI